MATLAKAKPDEIEAAFAALPSPPGWRVLRAPEVGSAMIRARAGGTGPAFNFGDITMTRCVVELNDGGPPGYAHVVGRNRRHAEIAAVFDAMLQLGDPIARDIVDHLAIRQSERAALAAAVAAASKVQFAVLARG
jgi:alpha-D-ribose 1-methylphosphonate 5-triphosphate synthase subunit PhnG